MTRALAMQANSAAQSDTGHLWLQRSCACGQNASELTGECDDCQRDRMLGLQARLAVGASDDPLEFEADRMAARVLHTDPPATGATPATSTPLARRSSATTAASGHRQAVPGSVHQTLARSGEPLAPSTRAFFEPRFGHDFSRVRIHRDASAAASARDVAAHAYTVGHQVVFADGRFAPDSVAGRHLLAHELAHVVQQHGTRPLVQREDDAAAGKQQQAERERARKRLEAWAAGRTPSPSTDPTDRDFAFTAQALAYEITHQPEPRNFELLDKPTDKAKLASWTTAFRDAYQLALMILDSKGTTQRESRAASIATDLATVGFTTEAMDVAGQLPDDHKEDVYEEVAKSPQHASTDQVTTLSQFFTTRAASPGDHPLLASLTDRSGAFAKKIGKAKVLAALQPTLAKYRNDADYREALAEILVFDVASRVPVSDWLWKADKDYLFELLDSEYFVEPGYDGTQFEAADGTPRALTMQGDMPWVYTYKQKFYVEYLVKLGARHAIDIKAPSNLRFPALKAWLDAETEDIGAALAAEHPNAPDKVTEAYQHIADIFFFHVDRGNVTPNLAGKLAGLGPDAPNDMRLKSDCDVLATYASRLLRSAGFIPVGYLAVEPDVEPSHAVALLKKALPGEEPAEGEAATPGPDRYYIVNNKQVTPDDARTKEDAITAARDDALRVYDPEPNAFKVFYEDAAADGAMTRDLWTTDEKVRRKKLGKDAPAPAAQP